MAANSRAETQENLKYKDCVLKAFPTETQQDADPDDGLAGQPEQHHPAEGDEHREDEAQQEERQLFDHCPKW